MHFFFKLYGFFDQSRESKYSTSVFYLNHYLLKFSTHTRACFCKKKKFQQTAILIRNLIETEGYDFKLSFFDNFITYYI